MKTLIYILPFLLCNVLHSQPFICNGDLFLALSNGGASELYSINVESDNQVIFNPLFTDDVGAHINAIGFRKTDNFIYGISDDQLIRLSAGGTVSTLSFLPGINEDLGHWAGDISFDGTFLYVLSTGGGITREFTRINLIDYSVDIFEIPEAETANIFCADFSIDPTDGSLYGFDWNDQRIVKFDPASTTFDENLFPPNQNAVSMGAMFFDAFGNLYGYGEYESPDLKNTLFKIDKTTGIVTPIATGPNASSTDGCGCPYTIKIQKTVSPAITVPCEEVTYTFRIVNASEDAQTGISFLDVMPDDLTISEIISNPFGGTINSGVGTSVLSIENLTIPKGLDSIVVRAIVAADANGEYKNQASLNDLPSGLGSATFSDDPSTNSIEDSTVLNVIPLAMIIETESTTLCEGDTLLLNVQDIEGVEYLWDDGSTSTERIITEEGWYYLQLSNSCTTITDSIYISLYILDLELGPDVEIQLGDSITINNFYSGNPIFEWTDPFDNSLSCLNCAEPVARPFSDVTYDLLASENGCETSASISIRVLRDQLFYIPNVFSPNGDGFNDIFYIHGKGYHEIVSLKVFNRWGALVFESQSGLINDQTLGWHGTFKGKPVNEGVYVYRAEIILLNGETIQLSGDVSVLR